MAELVLRQNGQEVVVARLPERHVNVRVVQVNPDEARLLVGGDYGGLVMRVDAAPPAAPSGDKERS